MGSTTHSREYKAQRELDKALEELKTFSLYTPINEILVFLKRY